MEISSLNYALVVLSIVYAFGAAVIRTRIRSTSFIRPIPVVGFRKQAFGITRASLRQLFGGVATLLDGYSQDVNPFAMYDLSSRQETLVPVKDVKWFAEQPDSQLSSHGVRQERHAVEYLHMGVDVPATMHFIERITGDRLTRNLDLLQQPMHEEIQRCIENEFGKTPGEWKEINIYDSVQDVVMPTMSRVFLGLPLCRDATVVNALKRYVMALGLATIFIGSLPRLMKSILAGLVKLPLAYYRRQTLVVLVPLIQRQLEHRVEDNSDSEQETGFLRTCARISEKNTMGGIGNVVDPEIIAQWIMWLTFAGSSSTIIQATNLILDIANCSKDMEVVQQLRQEVMSSLQTAEDWKTPQSFDKLILSDSAIRESLRFHPILIKGLTKEVVPSAGITLPDGTQMSKGSWIGIPVLGIHRDKRFYPEPELYDPFRFVPYRFNAKIQAKTAWGSKLDAAKPTATYLGFGYGRHACPGRWFATLMLKMILADIVLHYEIESTAPAPQMKVIGDAALPPMSATIRIRRRSSC